MSNGRVVVDEGQLKVCQGSGRYIKNPPYSPYVYDKVETNAMNRMMKEVGVTRTEEDFIIDDVEEPDMEDNAPQAVANQHKSSFDLKGHPAEPDPEPVQGRVRLCHQVFKLPERICESDMRLIL